MIPERPFHGHPWPYPEYADWRAVVVRVLDGDTLEVLLDTMGGRDGYRWWSVRLRGFDAPEVHRPGSDAEREHGFQAAARVRELVWQRPVVIRTYRDSRTYERYVADVRYWTSGGQVADLADTLRMEGYGKRDSYPEP